MVLSFANVMYQWLAPPNKLLSIAPYYANKIYFYHVSNLQTLDYYVYYIDFVKTLLKTALVRRLWYSDYSGVSPYQEPAKHSITSSLN